MQFRALATDYDGTLATHGSVSPEILQQLRRFVDAGYKLMMVTGRELRDLNRVFPHLDVFTLVVAENGGVLYDPARKCETLLCEPPSEQLVTSLRARGVPFSLGRAIIATFEPHEPAVREAVVEAGQPLHVILNKGSIMVLPAGVDKASGLRHAVASLGIGSDSVVGIGDAENDIEFLAACGCGVAVANALPSVKSSADFVVRGAHGAGVAEVMDILLRDGRLPCNGRERRFLVSE